MTWWAPPQVHRPKYERYTEDSIDIANIGVKCIDGLPTKPLQNLYYPSGISMGQHGVGEAWPLSSGALGMLAAHALKVMCVP